MKRIMLVALMAVAGSASSQTDAELGVQPAPVTHYSKAEIARRGNAAIEKVKAAIADSARDPQSVQYRKVRIASSDGSLICGEVNAKNGMGGYIGFRRFVNFNTDGSAFEVDDGGKSFDWSWNRNCNK